MPAMFDQGMFAHKPAWHRQGNVLDYWPGSWEEATKAAELNWDIITKPVYGLHQEFDEQGQPYQVFVQVPGYYQVLRDDTLEVMTISKDTRVAISNSEFGQIVEYVMGSDLGRQLKYETLVSLKGGRIVAVTMHLDQPFEIPGDPSPYMTYINAWTSHENGGVKIGATDVRIVCANTQQAADAAMNAHGAAWTIRHTSNWSERVNEARDAIQAALRTNEEWMLMAKDLAHAGVSDSDVETFLDKWMPLSTDMSSLQLGRRQADREQFRTIYNASITTDGIRGTKWGVLQTAIEMCDHYTRSRSDDTEIKRVLLDGDHRKDKAMAIVGRL